MKYVVLQSIRDGMTIEFPILFPDALTHADVAEAISVFCIEVKSATVVSAGFISSTCVNRGCHGKSESLNKESRGKTDDDLFKMMDYTHGIVP